MATVALLLPDLQRFNWTPIHFLGFFERDNVERVGMMPNFIILPFYTRGQSMIWQVHSGMTFTQTGGYLGQVPPEAWKWAVTSHLIRGSVGAKFGEEIRLYAAAHNVSAIVATPGTQTHLLSALDGLGWQNENVAGVRVFLAPKVLPQ